MAMRNENLAFPALWIVRIMGRREISAGLCDADLGLPFILLSLQE